MPGRRIRVPHELEAAIARLHPDTKRKVRATIEAIGDDPTVGQPLERELSGYWKIALGSWRIVYRHRGPILEIHAIGRRATVYGELIARLRRSVRDRPGGGPRT